MLANLSGHRENPEMPELLSSPGWVEIDLRQYAENLRLISGALAPSVGLAVVLKDDAYGHGAVELARIAENLGARFLVVATLAEALELRAAGLSARILILGERHPLELDACLAHDFSFTSGMVESLREINARASALRKKARVHLKIDTGMSRYGLRWSKLADFNSEKKQFDSIQIEGVLSHFAMSDELDKSFAMLQLDHFHEALRQLKAGGCDPEFVHICNSGGLLDLPQAHFNLVRSGILPLGVYPSKVCRRLDGILPVMSVKARVCATKLLEPGDRVGYGMRFTAPHAMRIATLGIGYGWGFPRVRNTGSVLVAGRRAPIIGGVSMDAITIDITESPEVRPWDEVVLVGRQGAEEITIHEMAELKNSVSYDALVAWRGRMPRVHIR
jgi:alanine racemase